MEELQWQGTMGTSRQKGGRDAGAKEGGAGMCEWMLTEKLGGKVICSHGDI